MSRAYDDCSRLSGETVAGLQNVLITMC